MSTNLYKAWIKELEQLSTKRSRKEQERKKQLPSIKNKLKQIQKNQDNISNILEKSKEKNLDKKWPIARLKENTNIGETNKIIKQINSLFLMLTRVTCSKTSNGTNFKKQTRTRLYYS